MAVQHTQPCRECPFRRVSMDGYLGGNDPQRFAFLANRDGDFPCHLTMTHKQTFQCAGRATMWANQCKTARDKSVPQLEPDRARVFANIGEFIEHHHIEITAMQLMGVEPLDEVEDAFDYDGNEEED